MTMKRFRAAVLDLVGDKEGAEELRARKAAEIARQKAADSEDAAVREAFEAKRREKEIEKEEEAKACAAAIRAFVTGLSKQVGPQLKGVEKLPDGPMKKAMLEVREEVFKATLRVLKIAEKLEGV